MIKNEPNAYLYDGFLYYPCSSTRILSLFIYIGDSYFEITPSSFTYPNDNSGVTCFAGIVEGESTYWDVGDPFFRNYYSVWDDPNNRIGLAPHIYTSARIIQGSKPTNKFGEEDSSSSTDDIISYLIYIIAAIISYLGGESCVAELNKRRKKTEANKLEEKGILEGNMKNEMIILVLPEPSP